MSHLGCFEKRVSEKEPSLEAIYRKKRALAEGVGFEPTVGYPTPVFKTGAFDHSATPPGISASRREDGETLSGEQEKVAY